MDLAAKSALLETILSELRRVLVADSASLPRAEFAAALAFTAEHNIPTQILP
jgi:pyridinium-3,5-biscarboxylic acid mononucleotide sulfurtransferase